MSKLHEVVSSTKRHDAGLWYLASPYSKYPAGMEQAFRDVSRVAGALMGRGVHVYCPIAHSHPIAVHGDLPLTDHAFWLPHDELHMERCVGLIVAALPSWESSYGINYEVERFRDRERPVLYLDVDGILPQGSDADGDSTAIHIVHTRLPDDSGARKDIPLARGLLDYFPDALVYVAQISKWGNDKHNPGQDMHHARGKSSDHADCIARHLVDRGQMDGEGRRHSGYLAWRSLALLQEELEQANGLPLPRGARLDPVDAAAQTAVEGRYPTDLLAGKGLAAETESMRANAATLARKGFTGFRWL